MSAYKLIIPINNHVYLVRLTVLHCCLSNIRHSSQLLLIMIHINYNLFSIHSPSLLQLPNMLINKLPRPISRSIINHNHMIITIILLYNRIQIPLISLILLIIKSRHNNTKWQLIHIRIYMISILEILMLF